MSVYMYECKECGWTTEVTFVGGPPKDPPRISHNTKKKQKCHGDLRRKYTPPAIRIK